MAQQGSDFIAVLDNLKAFEGCRDARSLQTQMISALARFGFKHASIIAAPTSANKKSFADRTLLSTWPKTWFEQYNQQNFVRDDPVVAMTHVATKTFRWSEVIPKTSRAKSIMATAREDHGLKHGICIPIRVFEGLYAAVSIAGEEVDQNDSGKFYSELIGVYAFNRLLNLGAEYPPPRTLTERQREIMHWIAAGKTTWDVGIILNLSVNTVNKTIANAMERLNVATRAQAVAEAIRRGEITP